MAGVLDGLRVLDFGRYIAGPFCAALLGDFGAEVIRIERLGGGEDRGLIPVGAGPDGGGAMFLAMNRNKLGMNLDPASPKGREITRKLVATADVVVANLPPSVLRSLALDLDSLRQVKPNIVLTTVTGFGAGGPLSHKHGFDGIGQAMSGAVYLSGMPEQPIMAKVPWVDFGTAFLSAFGTLAAREEAQIVAGQVYSPQQALDDEHIRAAHLLEEHEFPGLGNTVPLAPTPIELSETPGTYRRRAPLIGEHTDEILSGLGYEAREIAALHAEKVV